MPRDGRRPGAGFTAGGMVPTCPTKSKIIWKITFAQISQRFRYIARILFQSVGQNSTGSGREHTSQLKIANVNRRAAPRKHFVPLGAILQSSSCNLHLKHQLQTGNSRKISHQSYTFRSMACLSNYSATNSSQLLYIQSLNPFISDSISPPVAGANTTNHQHPRASALSFALSRGALAPRLCKSF